VGGEEDDDSVAADPFERAKAALRAAREARGAQDDEEEEEEQLPPHDPNDPLSRAQAALEAARRARESGGRIQRAREDKARAELEQLKGQREGRGPARDQGEPGEAKPPAPPNEPTPSSSQGGPRKREL
jgi:hypothetical protein